MSAALAVGTLRAQTDNCVSTELQNTPRFPLGRESVLRNIFELSPDLGVAFIFFFLLSPPLEGQKIN